MRTKGGGAQDTKTECVRIILDLQYLDFMKTYLVDWILTSHLKLVKCFQILFLSLWPFVSCSLSLSLSSLSLSLLSLSLSLFPDLQCNVHDIWGGKTVYREFFQWMHKYTLCHTHTHTHTRFSLIPLALFFVFLWHTHKHKNTRTIGKSFSLILWLLLVMVTA